MTRQPIGYLKACLSDSRFLFNQRFFWSLPLLSRPRGCCDIIFIWVNRAQRGPVLLTGSFHDTHTYKMAGGPRGTSPGDGKQAVSSSQKCFLSKPVRWRLSRCLCSVFSFKCNFPFISPPLPLFWNWMTLGLTVGSRPGPAGRPAFWVIAGCILLTWLGAGHVHLISVSPPSEALYSELDVERCCKLQGCPILFISRKALWPTVWSWSIPPITSEIIYYTKHIL